MNKSKKLGSTSLKTQTNRNKTKSMVGYGSRTGGNKNREEEGGSKTVQGDKVAVATTVTQQPVDRADNEREGHKK